MNEEKTNKPKEYFIKTKKENREKKRTKKRAVTADDVIFIFEKILEGWKTIKIYNYLIQQNPNSEIDKKKTENIATGNCKVFEHELSKERYEYYKSLRNKICEMKINNINTIYTQT